jgi:penicillin-binding protein-related factor A (putative recombinase)
MMIAAQNATRWFMASWGFTENDIGGDVVIAEQAANAGGRRAESAAQHHSRHAAGKQAKRHGDAFEAQLDAYHELLLEKGAVAYIRRQMPPMRSVYRGSQTVFVPTGSGPCDYIFVLPRGVAGIFDAKSTGNKKQFSWPKAQRHQLDEMHRFFDAHAGVAFALVEWRVWGEVRLYFIPTIENGIIRRDEGMLVNGIEWLGVFRDA